MAASTDNLSVRFNDALNRPLQYRCNELGQIIDEFSNKELQLIFPTLIENMFGISNQIGWGLQSVNSNNYPYDYDTLYRFLHPQGVVFKLCYKLLNDHYLKYDFPIMFVPNKTRRLIDDGMIPPFYRDKVKLDPQTRTVIALILNPFEYYMFSFAYFLVNPWLQRPHDAIQGDTLYLHLVEEYLSHFLPCDGSPVMPLTAYVVHPKTSLPMQTTNRPAKSPTLFRESVVLKQGATLHASPTLPQQSNLAEIWRSETMIQVFVDFWLSHGEAEFGVLGIGTPPRLEPRVLNQAQQPNTSTMHHMYPDHLPTLEHIRVVRNMLKHLHYFSNSATGDMSAMDELKRVILPSSQSRIYAFLRYTIHHWPLDSSFRIILETWLSYIQPWRYTNWRLKNQRTNTGGGEPESRSVDRRWINFIAGNLLVYTVIFRQLLPRFSRLDLVIPKNAYMLFRVTKVFAQPNLNIMLQEVEGSMEEVSSAVSVPSYAHKWCNIVRQQIAELEGPGYQYKAMFSEDFCKQVFQFMLYVQHSNVAAEYLVQNLKRLEEQRQTSGFLGAIKTFLMSAPKEPEEYSLEERTHVPAYLTTSLNHLCEIFQIERSRLPDVTYTSGDISLQNSFSHNGFHESSLSTPKSSQSGRQVGTPPALSCRDWNERRKNIKYEGDPDLEPIRTTECAIVVRLLHQITSKLNEMYTLEMCNLYESRGVLGFIARQVLNPPRVTHYYDKSPGKHPKRVDIVLPPRLSLRALGSYRTLVYLFVGYAIAWLFGYSMSHYMAFLLVIWIVYVLLKALLSSTEQETTQHSYT